LLELIAKDESFETAFGVMCELEKTLRLRAGFFTLLNNFVVFRDFYARNTKAIFQAGTLFIDGRSCELCVKVSDISQHASLASLSKTYLLYLSCVRGNQKINIAAAVTNGDSDNLMVGRNGVFYDRDSNDWDASVVRIVEFPISVRQAFWHPYKKVARLVHDQMEKFSKAREAAANARLASGADSGIKRVIDPKVEVKKDAPHTPIAQPPATPTDMGKFAGIFAALGLAVGAIGTAVASVFSGFLALKWWQMPLVVIGIMLAISLPSMVLAWLKLSGRNLGPLLDASGWAINTRAKINVPFGATLTQLAELPKGSSMALNDPYEDKNDGKNIWLLVSAVVICAVALASLFMLKII
jgi:hypothetical protein